MTSEQRFRLRQDAKDAFVRAAAALTTIEDDSLAFALLEAAIGLDMLAQLDEHEKAKTRVLEYIRGIQAQRKEERDAKDQEGSGSSG